MNWKAHFAIAIVLGTILSYFVFPSYMLFFSLLAGIGGLLPDLDLRKSKGSQILHATVMVFVLVASYYLSFVQGKGLQEFVLYAIGIGTLFIVADRLFRPKHRGIMHSIVFLLFVFAACFLVFGIFFALAVSVGYFSHLLVDKHVKFS